MRKNLMKIINNMKYLLLIFSIFGLIYVFKTVYSGLLVQKYMTTELIAITSLLEIMSFIILFFGLSDYLKENKNAKFRTAILASGTASLLELLYAIINAIYHIQTSTFMSHGMMITLTLLRLVLYIVIFYGYHNHKYEQYYFIMFLIQSALTLLSLTNAINSYDVLTAFNYFLALSIPLGSFIFSLLTCLTSYIMQPQDA
ncbi:MAG TPA: hypothetical protein DEO81_06740 [Erysipelotrichaceae bacterium]|uniref:hypothetical protein n=1 Tax=Sharpea azabuensis TaxID=322505 RepID=UPI0008E1D888|nr:hypothetical protein [Sharpea azabuensis]SFD51459.1 hypothetical protein SAMN04487836_102122 [Sharpea azabuensis]SFK52793.1 hypothetical protein SAMN04487835_102122 [Sharpea azabuensis]HBZ89066.1 hypothetical protein [Erysipelotrichaceae bacterium]